MLVVSQAASLSLSLPPPHALYYGGHVPEGLGAVVGSQDETK